MNGADSADYYKAKYERYKRLYEAGEEIRKADAAINGEREKLWREACKALLDASKRNSAETWREASKRLFSVAEELASDVVMLNEILAKRGEIEDEAFSGADGEV